MASEGDLSEYFTGTHEVQECLEGQGEEDLHTHLANCKKNPGHKNFVPVNQFRLEHFPSGSYDNDVYDLTKAIADLTVRIAVKLTSPYRQEFESGSKVPYPFYNTRGQNSLRTGTGRVGAVCKYEEGMDDHDSQLHYRTCPCPECERSATPSKVWWTVGVWTAKHVVYDSNEARQSICRLWFDDDKSPVVKIYGFEVNASPNDEYDCCHLCCATHDVDVAAKLEKMLGPYNSLRKSIREKYKSRGDKLTIIVSHPHGCSKQVSVGHWVHRQVEDNVRCRFTYTTPTCPGSSGALVYLLGSDSFFGHPHHGKYSSELNSSGWWGGEDL